MLSLKWKRMGRRPEGESVSDTVAKTETQEVGEVSSGADQRSIPGGEPSAPKIHLSEHRSPFQIFNIRSKI